MLSATLAGLLVVQLDGQQTVTPGASRDPSRGWEIHGRLGGVVPGWYGALIAVPALRIGAIAGSMGAFKLRSTAPGGCYEAMVRTYQGVTIVRFAAPDSGVKELEITIPQRPPPDFRFPSRPETPIDTVGSCHAAQHADSASWPAGSTVLSGRLERGGHPLIDAGLSLGCNGQMTISTRTDSVGRFRMEYPISFPADLMLADGRQGVCDLRLGLATLDPPLHLTLTFGLPNAAPPESEIIWALADANFDPQRVVGQIADSALRLGTTASFRPGILPYPTPTSSLEIMAVPRLIELYGTGVISCPPPHRGFDPRKCKTFTAPRDTVPRTILPLALTVATGQQVVSTGSDLLFAIPPEYAARVGRGERLEAFVRLPRRTKGPPNAYLPLPTRYEPLTQLVSVTLLDWTFDDEVSPDHAFEAVVIVTLRHR